MKLNRIHMILKIVNMKTIQMVNNSVENNKEGPENVCKNVLCVL